MTRITEDPDDIHPETIGAMAKTPKEPSTSKKKAAPKKATTSKKEMHRGEPRKLAAAPKRAAKRTSVRTSAEGAVDYGLTNLGRSGDLNDLPRPRHRTVIGAMRSLEQQTRQARFALSLIAGTASLGEGQTGMTLEVLARLGWVT